MRNGASPRSATFAAMSIRPGVGLTAVRASGSGLRTPEMRAKDAYRSAQGGVGWRTSEAAHLVGATTT